MLTKSIFAPCKIYFPSPSLPESVLPTYFLFHFCVFTLFLDLSPNRMFFLAFSPPHAPNFGNITLLINTASKIFCELSQISRTEFYSNHVEPQLTLAEPISLTFHRAWLSFS